MITGLLLAVLVGPPVGDYDHNLTTAIICTQPASERRKRGHEGYVSYKMKNAIYNAYGIPRGHRHGVAVIDHFYPISLGGIATASNLWPQPLAESYRKDRDEDYLHREVCDNRMTLDHARFLIRQWWGR